MSGKIWIAGLATFSFVVGTAIALYWHDDENKGVESQPTTKKSASVYGDSGSVRQAEDGLRNDEKAPETAPSEPLNAQTNVAEDVDPETWSTDRGRSRTLMQTYRSYELETLFKLAAEQDVYALQVAHYEMLREGRDAFAYKMLMDAGALGSSEALMMASRALITSLEMFEFGHREETALREAYGLQTLELPLKRALEVTAAAHLVAAGKRGDVHMAEEELIGLQKELSEPFTAEEWEILGEQAERIYQRLTEKRKSFGLEEFNNSYPQAHMALFDLPAENVWFEGQHWQELSDN